VHRQQVGDRAERGIGCNRKDEHGRPARDLPRSRSRAHRRCSSRRPSARTVASTPRSTPSCGKDSLGTRDGGEDLLPYARSKRGGEPCRSPPRSGRTTVGSRGCSFPHRRRPSARSFGPYSPGTTLANKGRRALYAASDNPAGTEAAQVVERLKAQPGVPMAPPTTDRSRDINGSWLYHE
jgi:hypothetical protein